MGAEIGLTPDSRWDIEVGELVAVTRAAGFTSLGIPASRVDGDSRAAYEASGMGCHEIMALLIDDDGEATLSSAQGLAEAAAAMGAPWVNTVFRAARSAEMAELIRRCAAVFAEAGTAMAVEFSPLGSVPSIRAGMEIVDIAGPGRAGLQIDTWHFSMGDSTWEDLEAVPVEKIAYIQFDDALAPESERMMSETMNRRVMPGDGIIDLDRFASTLLGRGWEGVVSVEVLNRELRTLPVDEFARRAYEATARYWT